MMDQADNLRARPGRRSGAPAARLASLCITLLTVVVLGGVLGGCAAPPPDERLHSTLWVQTSAEYGIATTQVYRMAAEQLDTAIEAPAHSALDFGDDPAGLPMAIVIDVDDTVLDNSGHTARAILSRQGFNRESWRAWVEEASAPAVPGAIEYLQHAADRGVVVIYLTNRHAPMRDGVDLLMTRRKEPGWTRDKSGRRRVAARRYRVLQVVGDDLADFIRLPEGVNDEQRVELARQQEDRWGTEWFMLPNPIYGSWEQALLPGGGSMFAQPMEHKFRHLETR
jgi:acid phosphatase